MKKMQKKKAESIDDDQTSEVHVFTYKYIF